MRTLKVFCTGKEQTRLAREHRLIERYPGFVLIEVADGDARSLADRYPLDDITDSFLIRTEAREIDTSRPRVTSRGAVKAHPAYRGAGSLTPGAHHYLVQFIGPVKAAWLRGLRQAGGEVRVPFGDFTYVVRADTAALGRVSALPFVRWVGHLPYTDRVSTGVWDRIGRRPSDMSGALPRSRVLPGSYVVQFFGSEEMQRARAAVRRLGVQVLSEEPAAGTMTVRVEAGAPTRRRLISSLSAVHGVRSIRERAVKRTSNNVAAGIMGTMRAMASASLGLSGKGETVAVCDTGLDTGDAATIHPDFAGRIAWIKSYPITPDFAGDIRNPGANDGPADTDSGHGTHTSGSFAGSGAASVGLAGQPGPIRGLAPAAKLVFQAVEQEVEWTNPALEQQYGRFLLAGLPNDLRTLFNDAYRKGARVHSDSWGGGEPGVYDAQCEQLDEFVWKHKDFCVVVAAGNDGSDSDGDGKINPMSVTSPGTAKNCITVGASESSRPQFSANTYGSWWPSDYPVPPLRDDPMADDPATVVAFSSRGPTRDGRVKPDVVAPGTYILSTRSQKISYSNHGWAPLPGSRLYFYMGGTSMATPLTAGAVTLLREYLRRRKHIAAPSAALLKAALIAGAERLSGTGAKGAACNNDQGHGRVNIDAVVAPKSGAVTFAEHRPGLKTGGVSATTLVATAKTKLIKVVLAYSDYPGHRLVNNLNLIVTDPRGKRHVGNRRSGGHGLQLDALNNVEVVQIAKPVAGTWTVEVVGSNVPQGPQEFALVSIA